MLKSQKTLHRDKVDQARANALKTVRTAIRLRHSLAADTEINEVLPKFVKAFDARVQAGELPDPLSLVDVLDD